MIFAVWTVTNVAAEYLWKWILFILLLYPSKLEIFKYRICIFEQNFSNKKKNFLTG